MIITSSLSCSYKLKTGFELPLQSSTCIIVPPVDIFRPWNEFCRERCGQKSRDSNINLNLPFPAHAILTMCLPGGTTKTPPLKF